MPGTAALAEDLPGDHGIQLVTMFQLGKLLLVAIQRDMHFITRAGLQNGLHLVVRLVIAIAWRWTGLAAARLARP
ncbi:hypothetical protein D3C76_1245550 [compost metagenome]